MASKCLQLLPPHHSRFSHTANRRMFACIIEEPFLFCSIADEGLSRSKVMSFLEQLQREFSSYVYTTGLSADQSKLEKQALDNGFRPIFERLARPYVGITQAQKDRLAEQMLDKQAYGDSEADLEAGPACPHYYNGYSNPASPCDGSSSGTRSPSSPLICKSASAKHKPKRHKDEKKGECDKAEHENGTTRDLNSRQVQRLGSGKGSRVQHTPQKMWYRSVKIVLMFDLLLCLILLSIWLGVCHGLSCVR
ncbi:hypothetical protein KP509_1Z001600 [Ceratopteris richardii]|nr:hypothetical protein KP509_1Z001600 [Ceratopteris richardii]